jgi:hypothetical protein
LIFTLAFVPAGDFGYSPSGPRAVISESCCHRGQAVQPPKSAEALPSTLPSQQPCAVIANPNPALQQHLFKVKDYLVEHKHTSASSAILVAQLGESSRCPVPVALKKQKKEYLFPSTLGFHIIPGVSGVRGMSVWVTDTQCRQTDTQTHRHTVQTHIHALQTPCAVIAATTAPDVVRRVVMHRGKPSAFVDFLSESTAQALLHTIPTCRIGPARVKIKEGKKAASELFIGWQPGCDLSEMDIRSFFADKASKSGVVAASATAFLGPIRAASAEKLRGVLTFCDHEKKFGFIRPFSKGRSKQDQGDNVHFMFDKLRFGGLVPRKGDKVVYTLRKPRPGKPCDSLQFTAFVIWRARTITNKRGKLPSPHFSTDIHSHSVNTIL